MLAFLAAHALLVGQLKTLEGQFVSIPMSNQPTVVIFMAPDCPIANSYQAELQRLYKAFSPKGVAFLAAYEAPDTSLADLRRHSKAFGLPFTAINDQKARLAKRYGAKTSPEAFLFDKTGKLCYHGRIDDLYYALGQRRPKAVHHDLSDAIKATLAGRKPAAAKTAAIGCILALDPS